MPAEALARPDHSAQLAPMSASDSDGRSISPSATRRAERAGGAREAHRLQGVARGHRGTPAVRLGDPLGDEQRAFHLNEVHVGRIVDAGVSHGGAHAGRHLVDLCQSAEMLEWERRRVGTADGERRLRALSPVARARTPANAAPCRPRCRPT